MPAKKFGHWRRKKIYRVFCICVFVFLLLLYLNHLPSNYNLQMLNFTKTPVLTELGPGKFQWIQECGCHREFFYTRSAQNKRYNSSCSDEGTFNQPNQSVVSYSLYATPDDKEQLEFYQKGIYENLRTIRTHYPGYSMRVYTANLPARDGYCPLLCQSPDLFWCDIEYTPSLGNNSDLYFMIWRFLPLGDETVDIFLSRDLDSVISEREAAAVQDWLEVPEKKPIHLMRDKFVSHDVAILGGMWGARNSLFGSSSSANSLLKDIFSNTKISKFLYKKGWDQIVLERALFIPRSHQIMTHDSYYCEFWGNATLVRPFPIQRKDNFSDFVGNTGFGKDVYELEKCPVECRPDYGKNWEYC